MFSAYIRLRHKYGFGIHSPFAYELIKTAISPGRYGFYGYEAIDQALETSQTSPRQIRNDARLLLRLLYALDIKRVISSPDLHPAYKAAIKAAGSTLSLSRTPSGREVVPTSHTRPQCPGEGSCPNFPSRPQNGNFSDRVAIFILDSSHLPPQTPDPNLTLIQFNTPNPDLTPYLSLPHGLILHSPTKLLIHPRPEMALTIYPIKM